MYDTEYILQRHFNNIFKIILLEHKDLQSFNRSDETFISF